MPSRSRIGGNTNYESYDLTEEEIALVEASGS
jgi:hypothetical protein